MTRRRILVLGGREPQSSQLGWHLRQLDEAANRRDAKIMFADYEALSGQVPCSTQHGSQTKLLPDYDAILTRTMPMGSLEQITFRLAVLHDETDRRRRLNQNGSVVNPPAGLEIAIDKFATLARADRLGIPTPSSIVVQSRAEAMEAFHVLGGDVVVKPLFGGEGRGVMRIQHHELAWTAFSTLAQTGSVLYVQKFIPPGGVDVRLLVLGEQIFAIRRTSRDDFRTNVKAGGKSELIELERAWEQTARRICDELQLGYAAVDLIESDGGNAFHLIEVNAIPGWKSAQSVVPVSVAEKLISLLISTNHTK